MKNFSTVILAAGQGTRMKSDLAKVLHQINNRPMVHYVIDLAINLGSEKTILIIGHQLQKVKQTCSQYAVDFAIQDRQLGTAHAVLQAEALLKGYTKDVLVLSGDVPLLTSETIEKLINTHQTSNAFATLLTSKLDDPAGYGRIIRDHNGYVKKIVEHKDASTDELEISEINVGIYIFKSEPMFHALHQVKNDNVQGEYYLPDVIKMYVDDHKLVNAQLTPNFDETKGINTVDQLKEAETILNSRRLKK